MLGKHLNHCEDSLTAAVFTHLLHLPCEEWWPILRGSCFTGTLPERPGEPEAVEYWPKWSAKDTDNASYVEPDVFLRFTDFDLIIEAKRWDDGMQTRKQWESEHRAYANEYGSDGRPVRMIALGGIHGTEDETLKLSGSGHSGSCTVHMSQWGRLLTQCKERRRELALVSGSNATKAAWVRVLDDLIDLCGWHGFSTGQWFKSFQFGPNLLSLSVDGHLALFARRSAELVSL